MDKDNTHIDSEFIDHSWREMSNLLEQEMPVKKRKKRILWICFLGLGLLGLIGLTYFTEHQPTKLKSLPIQQEAKIVTTKIAQNSNSHSSITPKKVPKKQTPTKSSDDTRVISTIKKTTKIRPTVKTPSTVGAGVSEQDISKEPSIIQKTEIKNQLLNKSKVNISKSLITEPALISGLTLPLLICENNQKQTFIIPIPKKNQQKWRFGLYAGALTPKLGSFRTGFHANFALNKKWAIHFGLGYAKRISTSALNDGNDGLNNSVAEADMSTTAGAPAPSGTGTGFSNEMEAMTNSSITYGDFHYFEAPILLQYTIRPKFAIKIGGNFSYLYGYSYQQNNISFFTKDASIKPSPDNRTANLSLANAATIRNINLSFIGGANYQITSRLNTYVNYHFSNYYLTGTTISTFPEKRWQQIEVGIRYYFK